MVYEFKSRATGSVLMLAPVAETLLEIIGKAAGPRGVITVEELGPAIVALQTAVQQERQAQAQADRETRGDGKAHEDQPAETEPRVSLAQRAFALIEMFTRARDAGKAVTWGL